MIDFQFIEGPDGVPIYYQRLPVNTVSVSWVVFVGSADDETVGQHGVYHWFEHLPSRGTQKYPGGYRDTEARLVRHGGGGDAETGYTHTAFGASVPKRVWMEALDILTDMIAAPLLRDEDIEAEREIILQEIDEWHSSPYTESLCTLPSILWPGHAIGHDQLGTQETLSAMQPSTLRNAYERGYSKNRLALFVAGDIEQSQVIDVAAKCLERMPNRDLQQRLLPAKYGSLPPWQAGQVTEVETKHADSVVYLLFPLPSWDLGIDKLLEWDFVEDVFQAGALGSPLSRLVREDSQLAYSPEFVSTTTPDGGYAGLVAQTSSEPERVLEAFWKLIRSDELRSHEWLQYVRDTIRGSVEMHDPDASDYVEEASASLIHYGRCFSDDQYSAKMLGYSDDQIGEFLERLHTRAPHSVIFRGTSTRN